MIARIRGKLISASPTCVVDVGGVGFEVLVPERDRATLLDRPDEVSFHTYLYVREDRLELFGFLHARDRTLFRRLIDVSGIGPRTALNILGEAPGERIVRAIRDGDAVYLSKLPGIGKKTAERLTIELKDKVAELDVDVPARATGPAALREEAILALSSLGMSRGAAERALEKIDWASESASDLESVIKQALKHTSTV